MKEIKAVIQPNKVEKVRNAFRNLKQFPGMTILKAQGCSSNEKQSNSKRLNPLDELNDFSNKIMIVMLCPDHMVEGVLQIIAECSSTGQKGDGIVWVTEAARVIRLDEKIAVIDEPPMFHG